MVYLLYMKYIISESRMNKVIKNYLDTKYESWYFSDIGDGEFTIYDGNKPVIKYRISPSDEHGYFIFSPSLIWQTSELFGMGTTQSTYPIINWLNDNFDTNVDFAAWDYIMDETDEEEF